MSIDTAWNAYLSTVSVGSRAERLAAEERMAYALDDIAPGWDGQPDDSR